MQSFAFAVLTLVASMIAIPGQGLAQEAVPTSAADGQAEPEPLWTNHLGLSYLATTGNSETTTFGVDLKTTRQPTPWGLEFSALLDRADTDGEKTAERYFANLRGTRDLTESWDAFVGLSAEKDEFAGIDLRSLIEAGVTYQALTGPRHDLRLDAALTWTDEDRLPPDSDDSWLGGLFALGYSYAINDNAAFSQGLKYFPNFDNSGDWRAESLTALTAALSKRLALRLSYEIRYRNEPLDLNDDTDTTSKASLVWSM